MDIKEILIKRTRIFRGFSELLASKFSTKISIGNPPQIKIIIAPSSDIIQNEANCLFPMVIIGFFNIKIIIIKHVRTLVQIDSSTLPHSKQQNYTS